MSRAARRSALAALGVALALAALEVAARVARARSDARLFDEARLAELPPPPESGRDGRSLPLGWLIRVSANPDLVYELRPGLDGVPYAGARVSTNADGFRDRAYAREKAPGTVRVLGLGDSVMFGQGVEAAAAYLAVLEERLNAERPARRWEVLAAAVPGYNTAQEVALLEERGLAFDPDLVVLGFVSNDVGLPGFLAERADVFSLRRSFLLDLLRRDAAEEPAGLVRPPTGAERVFRTDEDRDDVPERWRHLVGWDAVGRALDRLAELAAEHGFEVLVFVHRESEHSARALAEAAERGFETCNLGPRVARWLEERGLQRYPGSDLTVGELDPHPSALHHEMAADGLLRAMERSGLLERLETD